MAVCSYVRQDYSLFPNDSSFKFNERYHIGPIASDRLYIHKSIQEGLCDYLHQMDVQEGASLQQDYAKVTLYERNHYSVVKTGWMFGGPFAAITFIGFSLVSPPLGFLSTMSIGMGGAGYWPAAYISTWKRDRQLGLPIGEARAERLLSKSPLIDQRLHVLENNAEAAEEIAQLVVAKRCFETNIFVTKEARKNEYRPIF